MPKILRKVNNVLFVDFTKLSHQQIKTFEKQGFYEALPLHITAWEFYHFSDDDGVCWEIERS